MSIQVKQYEPSINYSWAEKKGSYIFLFTECLNFWIPLRHREAGLSTLAVLHYSWLGETDSIWLRASGDSFFIPYVQSCALLTLSPAGKDVERGEIQANVWRPFNVKEAEPVFSVIGGQHTLHGIVWDQEANSGPVMELEIFGLRWQNTSTCF